MDPNLGLAGPATVSLMDMVDLVSDGDLVVHVAKDDARVQ